MRKLNSFVASTLAFAAGAGSVVAGFAIMAPAWLIPSASAAAPPACVANGDYGQGGAEEDPDHSWSDDSRGTRTDMYVGAGPTDCQKISSIYVMSPTYAGFFEFGYVIGYSNCSGETYARPTLFNYRMTTTGTLTCRVWANRHPAELSYQAFRVSDTNANTYWGSYYNGEELQPDGVNMDFARGHSVVGVERASPDDSGYARWRDLDEYHDDNGWTRWNDATNYPVAINDPDYHFNRESNSTVSFVHD